MNKKLLTLGFLLVVVLFLVGCSSEKEAPMKEEVTVEEALGVEDTAIAGQAVSLSKKTYPVKNCIDNYSSYTVTLTNNRGNTYTVPMTKCAGNTALVNTTCNSATSLSYEYSKCEEGCDTSGNNKAECVEDKLPDNKPVGPTCTDSDADYDEWTTDPASLVVGSNGHDGLAYQEAGTVVDKTTGVSYGDNCLTIGDKIQLSENFCDQDGNIGTDHVDCAAVLPGSSCVDGACVAVPTKVTEFSVSPEKVEQGGTVTLTVESGSNGVFSQIYLWNNSSGKAVTGSGIAICGNSFSKPCVGEFSKQFTFDASLPPGTYRFWGYQYDKGLNVDATEMEAFVLIEEAKTTPKVTSKVVCKEEDQGWAVLRYAYNVTSAGELTNKQLCGKEEASCVAGDTYSAGCRTLEVLSSECDGISKTKYQNVTASYEKKYGSFVEDITTTHYCPRGKTCSVTSYGKAVCN